MLARPPGQRPFILENLSPDGAQARLLLLFLSPSFIAQMANFLEIPPSWGSCCMGRPWSAGLRLQRLHGCQLLHQNTERAEELFLEIVGQVLDMLRLRRQALRNLTGFKEQTISYLLPRLMQPRQFIEAHYREPIKARHAAQQVALSEYHLARLFKAAFGVTVHQYVLRLRLNEARRLLEFSDRSVTNISLAVGYSSLSAFNHAFRGRFGIAPPSIGLEPEQERIRWKEPWLPRVGSRRTGLSGEKRGPGDPLSQTGLCALVHKAVQLDLEAQGEIERLPRRSPIRLRWGPVE